MVANRIQLLKAFDRLVGPWAVRFCARLIAARSAPALPPSRVLVVRPGGIGDAVLLIPALSALKRRFPRAEIDVLAEARNAEVFTLCEAVTTIFLYHHVSDLIRLFRRSYDLVIDTEQWHRLSAVFAYFTRAPIRVGFATNERARLFTHCVPYERNTYEVLSFLRLFESVTGQWASVDEDEPFISPAPRYIEQGRSRPTVVVAPGASIPEKRWEDGRFADLVTRLVDEGCVVALVGGRTDRERGRLIRSSSGRNIVDFSGHLSLREVAAVLAGADALVTVDSGMMHLAYAVGTPTVALFGASNREKWAPRSRNHRILSAGLPCSPCSAFGYTPPCPIGVECLRRISVDDALAATLDVTAQGRARRKYDMPQETGAAVKSVVAL